MFVGVGGITETRQIHQLLLQCSSLHSSQEVIYNYEVHRSLLHMRGLLLHRERGGAQKSLGYSHHLDYIWMIVTD